MMRCESCESDVAEGASRQVPRAQLTSAAAQGFGPWGDSEPSMEWPRFVRALWWKGAAGEGESATLCTSCNSLLASFTPPLPYEHEWLAGLRRNIAAAGLGMPELPELATREINELAQQVARDIVSLPAGQARSLKDGYTKHGEKYGLAAATILLTGDETGGTLSARSGAADLLAEWDDPRATAALVRALRHPVYVSFVAPNVVKRGDPNALPEVAELLVTYLRLDDTYYAEGEPPYKTPFLDTQRLREAHPDIDPADLVRLHMASVAIAHLLRVVASLGPHEWRVDATREVYAHSLFHDDVMHAAQELVQFGEADDAALRVAGQAYEMVLGGEFEAAMKLLVQRRSAAGWWAMDRFCRTAEYWRDQAGMVRSYMKKVEKPSDEALRKYERRYGRFLDFKKSGKAAPATNSGCFIATAAYGSADHGEVVRLRAFRDDVLCRSAAGRAAIRVYECVSPPVARLVARSAAMRALVRLLILRPVRSLVTTGKEGT